jgi:hypothetical protein
VGALPSVGSSEPIIRATIDRMLCCCRSSICPSRNSWSSKRLVSSGGSATQTCGHQPSSIFSNVIITLPSTICHVDSSASMGAKIAPLATSLPRATTLSDLELIVTCAWREGTGKGERRAVV